MSHHEAYVEKQWEAVGLAHVLVVRHHAAGFSDVGMFLVDLLCLGVKDAALYPNMTGDEIKELLERRLPEGYHETFHPACAKKLIDGALAYAEGLGFAPHKDFRKARKVLSGIDATLCPRTFTYGRNGRPCYVRGVDDTAERVERVCAVLRARVGEDGFDYEDPGEDETDPLDIRDDLMAWIDDGDRGVDTFWELSGLVCAMQLCPTPLGPPDLLPVLKLTEEENPADADEIGRIIALLLDYWNITAGLIEDSLATPDDQNPMLDVWHEDFDDNEEGRMQFLAACCLWAKGFMRATTLWPAAWGDARQRPELARPWQMVACLGDIDSPQSREYLNAARPKTETLPAAVHAIGRTLRPR